MVERWLCVWTPSAQSRGGCLMPNISEWPNDAAVCSFLQVLELGPIPRRYFLSAKACAGILRRSEVCRQTLPEPSRVALESVGWSSYDDVPISAAFSGNNTAGSIDVATARIHRNAV
jgi:hypothetical protein